MWFSISSNVRGGSLKQFKYDPVLFFSYPLMYYDFTNIMLVEGKDTMQAKLTLVDSIKRSVKVIHKWVEEKKYMLIIPDSCFFSFDSLTNDSLIVHFRSSMEREFGSIRLNVNIDSVPGNYIIQLLDEKNFPIEERVVTKSGRVTFSYLNPKSYKIKAILDKNKNGRWDTGNYFEKLEPEAVFFYPKTLEIRANWDIEETWNL